MNAAGDVLAGVAAGAAYAGGRGAVGAGGCGVTVGTEIGVCDGTNGRAGMARGAFGVGTEGHGARGVGLGGGSVAPRGGVPWVWRIGADIPTGITPPHAEHLARTPPAGTFAGSTR